MPALVTTQEEADTRILLHCSHAADYSRHVVIRSPDTEVFILALSFYKEIGTRLYFQTGKGTSTRTVEVQRIHEQLGASVCDALLLWL